MIFKFDNDNDGLIRYNIETVKEMYTYIKNKYHKYHVQMHV